MNTAPCSSLIAIPRLKLAARGNEPECEAGYAAVLLLLVIGKWPLLSNTRSIDLPKNQSTLYLRVDFVIVLLCPDPFLYELVSHSVRNRLVEVTLGGNVAVLH